MKKKGKTPVKVQKMLGTEEQTMLSNIQSIIGELITMGNGEMSGMDYKEDGKVALAEGEMEETPEEKATEEKEVKMIIKALRKMKGLETTNSGSSTASDDAEERLSETQTEQTEENVSEVAKTLLANALGLVQKSSPAKNVDPMLQAVNQVVQVQKNQQEQFGELSGVVKNLLEGMGIVDQMKVAKGAGKTPSTPTNDPQNQEVLKMIQKALGLDKLVKEEDTVRKSNSSIARGNLGEARVLAGLLGRKI